LNAFEKWANILDTLASKLADESYVYYTPQTASCQQKNKQKFGQNATNHLNLLTKQISVIAFLFRLMFGNGIRARRRGRLSYNLAGIFLPYFTNGKFYAILISERR